MRMLRHMAMVALLMMAALPARTQSLHFGGSYLTSLTYRSSMEECDAHAAALEFTWKARGRNSFERSWNLPELGVGISWTDQSAVAFRGWSHRLEDLYSIYAVLRRDFGRGRLVHPGYDFNLGTAYTGNVYDWSNGYNWYYGTHFVCYVQAGAHVGLQLTPHIEALAEAKVMHVSNGRLGYPNQGMNFAGGGVGLRYCFGGSGAACRNHHGLSCGDPSRARACAGDSGHHPGLSCDDPSRAHACTGDSGHHPGLSCGDPSRAHACTGDSGPACRRVKISRDEYRRGWSLDVQAGGGVHTCGTEFVAKYVYGTRPEEYEGLRRWPKASLSTDIVYRYSGRWSTGFVADIFYSSNAGALEDYDTAIYGASDVAASKGYDPFSCGVGIVQMLHYRNVCAVFSPAVYLYRRMGIRDDHGIVYNRAGLRWYVHGGPLYVGAVIKAQPFKAEYFDFHVGWRFGSHWH